MLPEIKQQREQKPNLRGVIQEASYADLRFRRLLTADQWNVLPTAVKDRFTKRLRGGASMVYRGEVAETRMNVLGYLFAQALRLVGGPLPVDKAAAGTAAVVTVTEDPKSNGQFWTRQYNRVRGFPQVVQSAKAFAGPTGLEECVGYGIGMSLRLRVEGGSLLFVSDQYFVIVFGRRIYLPTFLAPGQLVAGHHDKGEGRFEFTLDIRHPLFGELVYQRAVFTDWEGV